MFSVARVPRQGSGHACEDCHSSCLECRGPGPSNCTACPAQAILEAGRRCLLCCRYDDDEDVEEDEEEEYVRAQQQECCNCTETRGRFVTQGGMTSCGDHSAHLPPCCISTFVFFVGECILSTNLPFRNKEEEEARGNLTIFIIACILLVLGLVAVVFLIRHSRSKQPQSDLPPRGYERLGSAGVFGGGGGGGRHGGYSSASSASHSGQRFRESELVDVSERRLGKIDADDDDDDEDEDIVYMGQDGTVYRKFRYGQLGENDDDELEYDDESYTFR